MPRYLILFFLPFLYSGLQAQEALLEKKILLTVNTGTVETLLNEVSQKGQFVFTYSNRISLSRQVSVSNQYQSVRAFLDQLFPDGSVVYITNENRIILSLAEDKKKRFTINGFVRDVESDESLIGASVYSSTSHQGTMTNVHGFYSFTLSKDSVELTSSYIGYQPRTLKFLFSKDTTINIKLTRSAILNEVTITSSRADRIEENVQMSTVSVPIDQIKKTPAILGETDVLKVLQLMPGVQSGNEGTTGLYVRGGGPDQNLILLDGVPVYNASHMFGFFSIFNPDAIKQVELIKGGFPARYGGRLSSVLRINTKEGNMKAVKGEASLGLLSGKFTVEGPIQKDKTSFLVSGRRTFFDLLANPFRNDLPANFNFFDFNVKINHIINSNNRIFLSTYVGQDKSQMKDKGSVLEQDTLYSSSEKQGVAWGNIITAMQWNHIYSPKLFGNITATYSRYRFNIYQQYEESKESGSYLSQLFYGNEYKSGIRDWSIKADMEYSPGPSHLVRTGGNLTWHRFSPGVLNYRTTQQPDTTAGASIKDAAELDAFIEDEWKVTNHFALNAGLHASAFHVDDAWYRSLQPRLSARYLLGREFSVKASYATMTQFIHLLTNAGLGLPTDLWVPSTERVKPQQAEQMALGVAKTYRSKYEISVEGFYKTMHHLIDYKDGASYLDTETDWQYKVETNGKGKSYGLEFLLQKKEGAFTGWIGYTLSKATRQFDQLNFGKEYPYKFDRRHDISVALMYTWPRNRELSLVFVYGTGNAITIPRSYFNYASNLSGPVQSGGTSSSGYSTFKDYSIYYGDRNSYRMEAYHRLDLSYSWWKNKKHTQRKWTVGVYNAYNHLNPYFITVTTDRSRYTTKFVQYALFPTIPSITYTIKFL